MPWFIYVGPPVSASNPTSYILVGPMPICSGTNRICAINTDVYAGFPIITCGLKDEMIDALNLRKNRTNVILKN